MVGALGAQPVRRRELGVESLKVFRAAWGPSTDRSSSSIPSACSAKKRRWSLVNSLRMGRPPATVSLTPGCPSDAFERGAAHVAAGHGVDLDDEAGQLAEALRQVVRDHRAQLDHRVVALALDPPHPHDHTRRSRSSTGVSKKNTCRIWTSQGVDVEGRNRRATVRVSDGELELDAVGFVDELQQPCELVARERLRARWGCCDHTAPPGRRAVTLPE
jgi:hypothetical protein